jgi:hypothetical protein
MTVSPIRRMRTSVRMAAGSLAEGRDTHQHHAARARHPHPVALDAGVKLAFRPVVSTGCGKNGLSFLRSRYDLAPTMRLLGMPLRNYVQGVLSGKVGHWNETNNRVVSEMVERTKALDPFASMVYGFLVLAANETVEGLIGYQREPLLKTELKKVSLDHFKRIYMVLLAFFNAMFINSNPPVAQALNEGFLAVVGSTARRTKWLLLNCRSMNSEHAGQFALDQVLEVLCLPKPDGAERVIQHISFIGIYSPAYLKSVGAIQHKLPRAPA